MTPDIVATTDMASRPELAPLPPSEWPKVDHLVTEDDTPVDNIFSEKQMRLLCEPLYTSWKRPGDDPRFLALANVGLFYSSNLPPVVPDVMLSLGVEPPEDLWEKSHRSYFLWMYGKPPEATIEVVSNLEGEELGKKIKIYARIGIAYYVVYDPENLLGKGTCLAFVLRGKAYEPMKDLWFPDLDLGLTIWKGAYEGFDAEWLRWRDAQGNLIPTGAEQRHRAETEKSRAEAEKNRAEAEKARAETEKNRADAATERAERLAAKLRKLGVEPNGE